MMAIPIRPSMLLCANVDQVAVCILWGKSLYIGFVMFPLVKTFLLVTNTSVDIDLRLLFFIMIPVTHVGGTVILCNVLWRSFSVYCCFVFVWYCISCFSFNSALWMAVICLSNKKKYNSVLF